MRCGLLLLDPICIRSGMLLCSVLFEIIVRNVCLVSLPGHYVGFSV